MAYKYKLLLIFFVVSIFGYSQENILKIKEYERLILETSHDTTKISLYRKIAEIYNKNKQFNNALDTQELSLIISRKGNYIKSIINSLKLQAYYNSSLGNYPEGFSKIREAIKLAHDNHYDKLGDLYLEKSWLNFIVGQNDSLKISANKMLEYSDDYDVIIHAHNFLGSVYMSEHMFSEAMEKFILVRDIAIKNDDPYRIGVALSNIASIHFDTGHYDEALSTIDKAMEIGVENKKNAIISFCLEMKAKILIEQKKYNEAELFLKEAEGINEENDFFEHIVNVKELQGNVYRLQKKYDVSVKKYKEVIDFEKKMGSNLKQSPIFTNLAQVFYDLKELDSSLYYLNLAKKAKIKADNKQLYNELLSKIYADKKEYDKAYLYYKEFVVTRDSIDSIAKKKEAYILEANYQFKQKEDEIEILNTQNKLRSTQLYLLAGLAGLTSLFLFVIYNRFKAKARLNRELEELDKTKTHFFTNISHEFRTPLSLMLGPIQTVLKNVKEPSDKANLKLAYKNGKRLHTMVNQLLDLSKIESNSMPLNVTEINLAGFIRVVFSYFNSMAEEKEIDYILSIDTSVGSGYIDKDKVEKILINLLSNAFKFTPNGGSIKLIASVQDNKLSVQVSDNGVGISKDKLAKIFNRFYQADNTHTRTAEGSGIGLALSKELAERHKGKLKANSNKNSGSEFTLEVFISKESYRKEEINTSSKIVEEKELFDVGVSDTESLQESNQYNPDKPLLLIAEDNKDMQSFISSILQDKYNILIASNGKEAYSIALEKIPDIIISDYMMPIVDGLDFSKMIREQEATSHIPIIMLTAKNEQTTKLESLEIGVSAFLTKPFNTDELQLMVKNMMQQQEKLKGRFTKNSLISVKDVVLPNSEKTFLERMMQIFEDKYSYVDFGIDQLSDELCLSRVQVYRKVKAITCESPGDLLRTFRLEKAKILLKTSSSNIGEITDKVGFGSQSNFASKFKKHTGKSPSEYISKKK